MALTKWGAPTPVWIADAKRREELGHRALHGIDPRWDRLGSRSMRLFYLDNIERCYAADPVQFKHFEPLVLALLTAKLKS